ncbi:rhamnogalacturonan acetylesterase [Silvibacterium dinghuense]|uniref:rhamnogalacturonan acetylesterase n=1 Tax=Silvibacterium dinghuense TaxID=1560006 RepID=UPI001E4BF6A9|nr:rhamnogalacturonan acetylesterase [Silvibacterium dinghuense]
MLLICSVGAAAQAQRWQCGARHHAGATMLTPATHYSADTAGWDLGMAPQHDDASSCSSDSGSFFFSAPVAEGNYLVTVVLGGEARSQVTVKAEARRLMLKRVDVGARKHRTEQFVVNVRRPQFTDNTSAASSVRLKPREIGSLDWDEKLTLEFAGDHPAVQSITIEPAPTGTPTVYIAGDSTVTDQDREPWAAWGEMLPALFGPKIAIANHAESGETIKSFAGERRFPKIFSQIQAGDFLMMQFGHNDQKPGKGYISPEEYADLLRRYIDLARAKDATPILVTPMNRRTFDANGHITDTLAPYPDVVRKVGDEKHVTVIDLNAMSRTLYEAIGEANSRSLFVYAAANTYPEQTEALHDDTHFNSYGAWELARCVTLGLQQAHSPLAKYLRKPHERFDPHHPDATDRIAIPPTPFYDTQKPYER